MLHLLLKITFLFLFRFIFCINGKCIVKKVYFPSEYEKLWKNKIVYETDGTKEWRHGCEMLRNNTSLILQWIKFSNERQAGDNPDPTALINSGALSYFKTQEICNDVIIHEKKIPIEPLVGFLRHPFFHCFKNLDVERKVYKEDKDYIIVTHSDEVFPVSKIKANSSSAFLFDLGANLYDGWQMTSRRFIPGSMSTKWFFEAYNITGIVFDRILCWESSPLEPFKIFRRIPRSVLGKISYYNTPVTAEKDSSFNPLSILKDVATNDDFVVIKIDIDAPLLEIPLIHQIMADPVLRGLIDELYFEHHVHGSPMTHIGWGSSFRKNETLIGSYEIFSRLRQFGIRAHAWV